MFFSDANGQIVIDNLRDGWYKVTELEPAAGFTIKQPATQEFYIKGGESKTVVFENTPLNGIVVEKYDSVTGEALPGCTFQLKYLGGTSGTGGTAIGTKVTGKNGTAIWTGLKPGTYVLEEVDPADGYSIIQSSETIFLADSGEQSVVTVRFTNAPDGTLMLGEMSMDKKESLLKQRDEAKKEAQQYENQVKILLNKQRDAERHARNHRLIVHGAIMEGVFPFTASMEGESLKAFLIALSRLPGASEATDLAQKTSAAN